MSPSIEFAVTTNHVLIVAILASIGLAKHAIDRWLAFRALAKGASVKFGWYFLREIGESQPAKPGSAAAEKSRAKPKK